eukprot:m.31742 g.31742  ORF g.31742 m.31742 type:complete len:261 (+) comp12097_c0_seq3:104-886(+)
MSLARGLQLGRAITMRTSTPVFRTAARLPVSRIRPLIQFKSTSIDDSNQATTPSTQTNGLMQRFVQGIGYLGGFYARKQTMLRNAKDLYMTCAEVAMHPQLYRVCQLPDTFQSWFLVTQLHLYMMMVRLKSEGSEGKYVYKQMVVFFWDDVDHRMKSLGDVDRSMVQESTRELFSMFHGLLFAYDEGLEGDDTVLAAALWRNLFHDSKTDLNVEDLASMVAYVRREMAALDMVDAEQLIGEGKHTFGPRPEAAHIKAKTA